MTPATDSVRNPAAPPPPRRAGPSFRLVLLAVGLCACLIHVAGAVVLLTTQSSAEHSSTDLTTFYRPVAENLIAGRGLVDSSGAFAVRYPPGQPLWLAGIYSVADAVGVGRDAAVLVANGILAAGATIAIGCVAASLVGPLAGIAVAALSGLHPLYVWLSREGLSEPLFTFLAAVGVALLLGSPRGRGSTGSTWWTEAVAGVSAGVALGAAALVRPFGLVFVPWLVLSALLLRDRRARSLWGIAVFLVVVVPWIAIASRATGGFVLLSSAGSLSHLDGIKRFGDTVAGGVFVREEWAVTHGETGILAVHGRAFAADPGGYVTIWIRKLARAWYGTDAGWGEPWIAATTAPFVLAGIAGFVRLARDRRVRGSAVSLALLLSGAWAMAMVALTIVRYLVPFLWIPILFAVGLFAGTGAAGRGDPDRFGRGLPRWSEALIAGAGLVVMSPVLVVLAVAVRLTSRGPALFRQRRLGRAREPFVLLKFRTMRTDPVAESRGFEPGDSSRITRIGRFLRATKLDELPQLWNVTRGDMSLVGPRPEVEAYANAFTGEFARVFDVRPGITDPASIRFRNEERVLAGQADPERFYRDVLLPAKIRENIDYLRRRTVRSDLAVICRTVVTVSRGGSESPEKPTGPQT